MTAGCTLTDVFVCHCSVRLCWNGAFFVRGWLTIRRTFRAFCAEEGKTALLAQWDLERNLPLTPKDVTYGSHQKVWWRCPQGHSYRSKVRILARGTDCPVCAGRVVLPEEEHKALPRLALGAEIAWVPNLAEWPELSQLCLGASRHFLLELPFSPWTDQLINRLYELPGRPRSCLYRALSQRPEAAAPGSGARPRRAGAGQCGAAAPPDTARRGAQALAGAEGAAHRLRYARPALSSAEPRRCARGRPAEAGRRQGRLARRAKRRNPHAPVGNQYPVYIEESIIS